MDKKLNLALVGFGRFGKKYFKEIKKNNYFSLNIVFRKNVYNNKIYKKLSLKNIISNNINAAIICTPSDTHYKISKLFIQNRIPIILEKPAASNIKQIRKLIQLSKKNKTTVIINHSDLFNENFIMLVSKLKLIGKIHSFTCYFGKFSQAYKNKKYLPYQDWFPHPLAIILKLFNKVNKVQVNSNSIKIKNKIISQKIEIFLKCKKNINGKIFFSNQSSGKKRIIKIYGKNGMINYDGYNYTNNYVKLKKKLVYGKSNRTPLENIIKKLHEKIKKKRFYSDLKLSLEIEKIMVKIKKKL